MLTKFKLVEIEDLHCSPLHSSDGFVYDLEVEDDHSYNIAGIVVHNSGNSCSTRLKAGIGVPQRSAIIECADMAHGLGGHIEASADFIECQHWLGSQVNWQRRQRPFQAQEHLRQVVH